MEEVKIDNTTRATATPVAASTPAPAVSETSSTSSTPAPEPIAPTSEQKPPAKTSGIATEFATRVAALVESSTKKEDSPIEERESETPGKKTPEPTPVPADPVTLVKEVTPQLSPSPSPEVEALKTPQSATSSLSVTTDMKREDSLYEPVSPTPLPDSPSEDTNKPVAVDSGVKPSPFQEVINKKAAGSPSPDKEEKDDSQDGDIKKGNKKKQSAAAKKAALNSKGEKKGDLLDVITSIGDKTNEFVKQVNDVTDDVEKLTLNKRAEEHLPESTNNHVRESVSPSDDVAPKINGVSEAKHESDLEEGEIIEEEEENDQKIKLKYQYAIDQWSPVNPSGKKAYGREFLICLMRDPLSLQKPNNLPNMEIVKDKPNLNQKPQARYDFFTPNFVKGSTSGPRGPQGRRSQGGDKKGRGGDRVDGKPRMVINLPSISAEVKLNKAENAWTPSAKAKSDPTKKAAEDTKESADAELRRKAIAILNKLTPQKFETLVQRFQELAIDTPEKLSLCMELVFEKAVDEPSFSVAYAAMCGELQKKKVVDETGKEINFRKLLIMRCQTEFEKEYMDPEEREKYLAEMEACTDEDEKKRLKVEFGALERRLRKRSLGNIRFIGELYKLGMLTARIMHECVRKLLAVDPSDEESLECLCRLVTTVGQNLDIETKSRLAKGPVQGLCDMSNYFKEMNKLVNDKKTSSRVRFLLQDVVDLERNGWRKRREDAGPKTIDQIHKEVEKEQMEQKLAHMTSSMGPPPARRQDDRRYDRGDDRRRSTKGGAPGGGGGGQQDGDGWTNVPTKAARVTQDRVDTNRLKNMQSSKVDADQMSFGPPKGGPGGAFGSWGRGSQTKTSRQEGGMRGNMFDALNQGEDSGPGSYQGRGSDGRRQDGRYAGRSSRDNSQASGRDKALAAAREAMNPRSQSVMGPPPSLSRENSGPNARSHSMVQQNSNNSYQDEASLLKGADNTERDLLEKWTKSLLDEFLNIGNFEEALQEITEKFSNKTISTFIEIVFEMVLEKNPRARSQTGALMAQLLSKRLIASHMFLAGLGSILEIAEDLLVDIPQFWDFIAQIISPVLTSQAANMEILKLSSSCLMSGELGTRCAAGKYVSAVLHDMAKSGQPQAASLWASSGLQWADFLQETPLDQFLKDNKLEWTMKAPEGGQVGGDQLARELSLLLKSNRDSNEPVICWIDKNCADRLTSPAFIHLLTTSVVESCIDGVGGPTSQCQLGSEQLKKRNPMLRKYIENNSVLEGEALLALQYLMHRLEHPNKLLHSIFEILYEDDIIGDDAFLNWETNSDPAKQEGKGVALKSCTQFLIFIKEAEADSDNE